VFGHCCLQPVEAEIEITQAEMRPCNGHGGSVVPLPAAFQIVQQRVSVGRVPRRSRNLPKLSETERLHDT
jgi:hypothetical protein